MRPEQDKPAAGSGDLLPRLARFPQIIPVLDGWVIARDKLDLVFAVNPLSPMATIAGFDA